jgi:S-adenosylmethionine:tRNA ribosyltransferase-isomerase
MAEVLNTADFDYDLPDEKIAYFPADTRDSAKLLVYDKGRIVHSNFKELAQFIPSGSLIIRNITKVVQARLIFKKPTGTEIEIFCLHPLRPFTETNLAMQVKGRAVWQALAGNLKKWKANEILSLKTNALKLDAKLLNKDGKFVEVEFSWEPSHLSWAEVLHETGRMPLPPYIQREATTEDAIRYQTIYAGEEGAVAAPTAGLHFTDEITKELINGGHEIADLTLHVGAGTFLPVEEENALNHIMHTEEISFEKSFIEKIASNTRFIVAVGTTSLRALESLYWYGAKIAEHGKDSEFFISEFYPYQHKGEKISAQRSFQNILDKMNSENISILSGRTEIFIYPSYLFKVVNGLITNFHQPKSTLLMLISAFIGDDWKKVYKEAIENNYRFLSYGDSSFLIK